MLKPTPWTDQAHILTGINNCIFSKDATADSVIYFVNKFDLDMDTLKDQAPLLQMWLTRFPNHKRWGKACANIVEYHALSVQDVNGNGGLKSYIDWSWLYASALSLPYASERFKKAWSEDPVVPFWKVYRGFDPVEKLTEFSEDAWQSFANGIVSTQVPYNVLFDLASKCWDMPQFATGTRLRGLLATLLYRRGALIYHERMTFKDLKSKKLHPLTMLFVSWGYSATAYDFDGKHIKLDDVMVAELLEKEAHTVVTALEIDFDGNPVADSEDPDDVEYVIDKAKAPWVVMGNPKDVAKLSYVETVVCRLPKANIPTTIDFSVTKPISPWLSELGKGLAALS